jgi:hypothetical protein
MGQRGPRGPQVEITITDADGEVVNTVSGSGSAGIHTVRWNFRGPAPEPKELGPYEKAERERISVRAKIVADSLIEAGWQEQMVNRMTRAFTSEEGAQALFRTFRGGGGGRGGQTRDPEAFQDRPAEQMGGGGFGAGQFGQMREIAELVMPGQGTQSLMRRFFRGGGGQGPMMEPGTYTLTLKVGDRTLTQMLVVERINGYGGDTSPF